jgi:multidrug efflux pump subunit AcrA (membrane-fusion protein)
VLAKEDNDIQMRQALVTMELSEAQLKAATRAREAVTGVRIDQLKEAFERSKAAYQEAQDKLPFLVQEPYDNGVLLKPIPLAPAAPGRILEVHASRGQFVQAGDPLWTIGDWSTLWIRVPVFAGDLNRLSSNRPAMVELPGNTAPVWADPLDIPTPVEPHTRTVDLKFTLDNPKWKVRVGQSAVVELPISEEFEALVIPRSAVLLDGFGQAYCYVAAAGSDVFQRRRIELGSSTETGVAVLRGLAADDVVVSAGAEQLAAEESKSELAVEDDD